MSPTPGVCIFSNTRDSRLDDPSSLVVHELYNRALLARNTEAHDVALMYSGPTRAFDPEIDILCIPKNSFDYFTSTLCVSERRAPWVSNIRHLAIPLSVSDSGLALPLALLRLTSLTTISIVYPAPSGTFDCFQDMAVPAERGVAPRLLTEQELASITIEADYMYDTWAGAFPVRWTSNGVDYLKMVETTLNRACRPENSMNGEITSLWDHESRRLKIKYEGRCFKALPVRQKFHG